MSFEVVRLCSPLILQLNLPWLFYSIISRVILFGQIFGVLSLFTSSLYASGLHYEKLGRILFIIILLSLTASTSIPINSGNLLSNFTFKLGYYQLILVVFFSIQIISIINFLISTKIKGSKDYFYMGLAAILVFLGKNCLFFAEDLIIMSLGFLFFMYGSYLFIKTNHSYYLWT